MSSEASETPYDVAISFLADDLGVARALHAALSGPLSIFMFERAQEDIGGTDGIDTFRKVYGKCRLAVVLYRDGWGKTKWTALEESVLKDRYLNKGAESIAVVSLERGAQAPGWYPDRMLRLSLADFGLPEIVGAIKALAKERGAELKKDDAVSIAARIETHRKEQDDRRIQIATNGVAAAKIELSSLFAEMKSESEEISVVLSIPPKFVHDSATTASVRSGKFLISADWLQEYANSVEARDAVLLVREQRWDLPVPSPMSWTLLRETRYSFDYSSSLGWFWAEKNGPPRKSKDLADALLQRLLRLVEREGPSE